MKSVSITKLHMVTPCHFAPYCTSVDSFFLKDKVYDVVSAGLELARGYPVPALWMLRSLIGTIILILNSWQPPEEAVQFLCPSYFRWFHRDRTMTTALGGSGLTIEWGYEYLTWRMSSVAPWHLLGHSQWPTACTNGVIKNFTAGNLYCGRSGGQVPAVRILEAQLLQLLRSGLSWLWSSLNFRTGKIGRVMKESFLGNCASWINSCCYW